MHLRHPSSRRKYFGDHESQAHRLVDEDEPGFDKVTFVALLLTDHDADIRMVAHYFHALSVDEERKGVVGRDTAELIGMSFFMAFVVDAEFVWQRGVRIEVAYLGRKRVDQLVQTGRGAEVGTDGVLCAVELVGRGVETAGDGQFRASQAEVDVEAVVDGTLRRTFRGGRKSGL